MRKVGSLVPSRVYARGRVSSLHVQTSVKRKEERTKERKKPGGEAARTLLERGRCSGSRGREYVRQITYYDALLYTNTNTYGGLRVGIWA